MPAFPFPSHLAMAASPAEQEALVALAVSWVNGAELGSRVPRGSLPFRPVLPYSTPV